MSAQTTCPDCQRPLPDQAPQGICPECLLKRGLGSEVEIGTSTETPERKSSAASDRPPFTVEELTRLFPQLEVLSFIGRGGMGAVYQARQKQLGRVVALKILPPEVSADLAFAERFAREARALARLNHPNIVTIHDFGETDGLFFLVMEYVDGVNLRQLLQAARVSPREALAIVPQICDALQFAHDLGIVHRDIKPENILLDRLGRVKVADFGLAKLTGTAAEPPPGQSQAARDVSLTGAGHVLGTPPYMAPEQQDPCRTDHRADIYALGVVFYELLTGELPGKPIEPPSKKVVIDVRLDEVVLRALEQEPARRYQTAAEVKTHVATIATTPTDAASAAKKEPAVESAQRSDVSRNAGGLPLFVQCDGRRHLCWPGVFLLCGTVGLVVMAANLVIALVLWMLAAPVRLTFTTSEFGVLLVLLGICALMRVTAFKLAAREAAEAAAPPTAKPGATRVFLWTVVMVILSAAIAVEMVFFVGWMLGVLAAASTDGEWLTHIARITRVGLSVAALAVGGLFFIHSIVRAALGQKPPPPAVLASVARDRKGRGTMTLLGIGLGGAVAVLMLIAALTTALRVRERMAQQTEDTRRTLKAAEVLDQWRPKLRSTDVEERRTAASRIMSQGRWARPVVPDLIQALGDEDDLVRMLAAQTLGYVGEPAGSAASEALQRALGDTHQQVRHQAAVALASVDRETTANLDVLMDRLTNRPPDDPHGTWPIQRREAAEALGVMGSRARAALPVLRSLTGEAEGVGEAAQKAIDRIAKGDGEFRDVRFSAGASAGKSGVPARDGPASGQAGTIRRVVVTGDKAVVEGHTGTGAVLACGLRGMGLTLFNALAADSAFTAEVGYTEKRGLSLGTRRTGTGVTLSATISDRELDPSCPFAEGRVVFRQGARQPEPDGSYLIADFHRRDGSPVPVFVRLQATAGSPRTVVAEWLRQVKAGHREAALALTTGAVRPATGWYSSVIDPPEVDAIRPVRQLGNQDQAMVVTAPFRGAQGKTNMICAVLLRRDDRWLIDSYRVATPDEITQLMQGFQLNQGVRFDVPADDLVGGWHGACMEFSLEADGTGQWLVTGPEGPLPKPIPFRWEVKASSLILRTAEGEQKLEITWLEDDSVRLRFPNGQGRVVFRNRPHRPAQAPSATKESLQDSTKAADKSELNPKPASPAPPAAAAKGSGATSDDEGPWGQAVEGVSVRLRAVEPDAAGGELPVLAVDLQNRGPRDLLRSVAGQRDWQLAVDGKWYVWPPVFRGAGSMPLGPNTEVRGTRLSVSPIWQEARPEELDESVVSYESTSDASDAERPLIWLAPGKHTIRVACLLLPRQANSGASVRVVSNSVELELPERRYASWPASPEVAKAVIELHEQCNAFIQPTATRKGDKGLAKLGELQATVGRLIKLAAGTPLEIVAESLSIRLTSLEITLKDGGRPSPQTLADVTRPARDLVALLGGERGPHPADFGIEAADPDLALAKMYDGECNRGIGVVADQGLAEKHYLAHIARTVDTAAKARAWIQIGTLYSTSYQAEKGEKPDFEKARRCFAEALKLEPRRIGRATVMARTKEVVPGLSAEERLRIRVRTVKWLKSIDEPTLRRDWLPDERRDEPTESDIRGLLSLVAKVQSADENNLVGDASNTADPAGSLKWVMAELPGSAAAAAAQRRLDELAK